MPEPDVLAGSPEPLSTRYDVALIDLDGVVYVGQQAVPYAAEAIATVRQAGMRIGFVTNNASRRPAVVAELLATVGVDAHPADVVTAAQASAALLAERLPGGAPVLVVGGPALVEELAGVGLRPVSSADERPLAVVQGYATEVGWRLLAEASVAIRSGAFWVATNVDVTVPSPRGPLPGNGALVAALATALGRGPDDIVGKPHPRLLEEAAARLDARRPLMIGDRLDTDIEGAQASGMDSLLVLTGVTTPADLLAASPGSRPTYVAEDLRGLATPHPEVAARADRTVCADWTVRSRPALLELSGGGSAIDALRALAVAAWRRRAEHGAQHGAREVPPVTGDDPSAMDVLTALRLGEDAPVAAR